MNTYTEDKINEEMPDRRYIVSQAENTFKNRRIISNINLMIIKFFFVKN